MAKGNYIRTRPVWNKGLTKETDSRVLLNSIKRDTTKKVRYGDAHYNNIDKIKKTNNDKYGCDYAFHIDKERSSEKRKRTCKQKYGVDVVSKNENIKKKSKDTFKKNHNNIESNFSISSVREKINEKIRTKQVSEKKENTCLEKYGVKHPLELDRFKDKKLKTTEKKYGVPNYTNKEKEYITRKNNGVYNKHKTKIECEIENILVHKYGKEDIIYQYRSEKYPYVCDFYIKSLDLYIEINAHWTHGPHVFNENNINDIKKLNQWKEKKNKYYNNAIYTWTDLDRRKIKTAIDNNLNFIVIYTNKDNNIVYTHKKLCEGVTPVTN